MHSSNDLRFGLKNHCVCSDDYGTLPMLEKNISRDTWDGSIHKRVDLKLKHYSFDFAERGFLHLVGRAVSSRPLKNL